MVEAAAGSQHIQADVEEVAKQWGGIWLASTGANPWSNPPAWMVDLKKDAAAAASELPPITASQCMEVARRSSHRAGPGLDRFRVAQWHQLPRDGFREMARLLSACEQEGAWPFQLLAVGMAKPPKPTGGHRLVALTMALYRMWSAVRGQDAAEWEAEHSRTAFWDRAIRGSQALRGALVREFRAELASLLGASCSEILWDIEKFYDHMVFEQVVLLARTWDTHFCICGSVWRCTQQRGRFKMEGYARSGSFLVAACLQEMGRAFG